MATHRSQVHPHPQCRKCGGPADDPATARDLLRVLRIVRREAVHAPGCPGTMFAEGSPERDSFCTCFLRHVAKAIGA